MGPETSNPYGRGIGSSGSRELGKPRAEDQIRDAMQKVGKGFKEFGNSVKKISMQVRMEQ